jgi:hypothetical protein
MIERIDGDCHVISIIDGCPGDDEFCGNLESVGNSAAALASRHIPEISDHEAYMSCKF